MNDMTVSQIPRDEKKKRYRDDAQYSRTTKKNTRSVDVSLRVF
jgi:hypothetical protein